MYNRDLSNLEHFQKKEKKEKEIYPSHFSPETIKRLEETDYERIFHNLVTIPNLKNYEEDKKF